MLIAFLKEEERRMKEQQAAGAKIQTYKFVNPGVAASANPATAAARSQTLAFNRLEEQFPISLLQLPISKRLQSSLRKMLLGENY